MKIKRLIIWALTLCLLMTGFSASAITEDLARQARAFDWKDNVQEAPEADDKGFILPSISVWRPYTSGDQKHVRISSSGEWYVKSCPEWVKMYTLREKEGSYEGRVTWELQTLEIGGEPGQERYPDGADIFLEVEANTSEANRVGSIVFSLDDGTEARVAVLQAQYVDDLTVEIVKPSANALDTVPAGQKTKVEIRMNNAARGRVQITDSEDQILYSQMFEEETYSFDFVFEAGCYVITAEAAGEERVASGKEGYVCKQAVVTAYELEYIEEIGVTRQYVEYIKMREGKRNMPYLDSAGNWTIGYGHLIDSEAASKYKKQGGWTDEQCEQQLLEDLKRHADSMKSRLPEEVLEQLTPNQFDALMSLDFNGSGRAVNEEYRLGRCIRNLDAVQDYEIINGFASWHGIENGKYDLLGLYYRRMEEAWIFLYADYSDKSNWPIPWWLNVGTKGKGLSIHDVPSGDGWLKDILPQLETSIALIDAESAETEAYVTIDSSSAWNITIGEEYPWLTASSYRGSNGSVVKIQLAENPGEARSARVIVSCGVVKRTIHVHQEGAGE